MIESLRLSREIAEDVDPKFWITFVTRLGRILESKQSDCETYSDIIKLYRAQGSTTMLKRILTTEIINTLKELGVSVPDASKK